MNSKLVAVVDYGSGNLRSVSQAVEHVAAGSGHTVCLTQDPAVVMDADRFGISQLHQLRGRVGRGAHHSYCVLVCSDGATDGMTRLQVLERTRDGFEIAEADLRLRGPGELLGEKQSGLRGLRLGDLVADAPLIIEARALAEAVLQDDPELTMARHQPLRALLHQPETAAVASAN